MLEEKQQKSVGTESSTVLPVLGSLMAIAGIKSITDNFPVATILLVLLTITLWIWFIVTNGTQHWARFGKKVIVGYFLIFFAICAWILNEIRRHPPLSSVSLSPSIGGEGSGKKPAPVPKSDDTADTQKKKQPQADPNAEPAPQPILVSPTDYRVTVKLSSSYAKPIVLLDGREANVLPNKDATLTVLVPRKDTATDFEFRYPAERRAWRISRLINQDGLILYPLEQATSRDIK